ncbi:MAG TPA: hypothetical protein VF761_07820 [Gemmatimonadaceae bacterium]
MTDATRARIWRWVAMVPLIALGALALTGGSHDLTQSRTAVQRMQVAGQFVFGIAALLSAVALAMRSPLARRFYRMFVVGVAAAAGLAPVAWAEASWWQGAVALLGALVIAWLIWLPFERGDRPPPPA